MRIIDLLNAKDAIQSIAEKRFTSFKKVRELVELKKAVDAEIEFYAGEEKKIVEAYAKKDDKGSPIILEGGRIQLDSIEKKNAFEKEVSELRGLEVDKIKPIALRTGDFRNGEDIPTPAEVLALEGIVDFID